LQFELQTKLPIDRIEDTDAIGSSGRERGAASPFHLEIPGSFDDRLSPPGRW
jgi:hypothetical protein